jgi:hypothetical protein
MARQLYQLSAVQDAFAARIRAKVQDRRADTQERVEDVPLIGWLLRPLAGLAFDSRESRNTSRGERGEESVLGTLLRWLPDSWIVFHNVVVEPQPDDFAQIDLLVVGTAGIFLVETKAWRGSYKGYRDSWQQREGNALTKVSSPTAQVQRQVASSAAEHAAARPPSTVTPASTPSAPPLCRRCGVSMVLRTARQGANVGKQFYGCPNFPRCREVQPTEPARE